MSEQTSRDHFRRHLRRHFRQQRQALSDKQRQAFDRHINQHLVKLANTHSCQSLAAFMAFDGEPDISPALQHLHETGCQIVLPVIHDQGESSYMSFHHWSPGETLAAGSFGIATPVGGPRADPAELDLVLMPLVAWNSFGVRLGMGAGYYDRALQPLAKQPRPLRCGVAYQAQKSSELTAEPWDVPLHCMVTESGPFTCAP